MKKTQIARVINGRLITYCACFIAAVSVVLTASGETLDIDSDAGIVKTLNRSILGENTTWLLSSDKNFTPTRNVKVKDRVAEMGVSLARYPYGALSQNYRWHTPTWDAGLGKYDYSDAVDGLEPRVSSLSGLGNWTWAVNDDGTYKEAMDFDEFIEHCHYVGMEPLIVINAIGHKVMANDDPAISQLGMPHPMTEDELAEEAAAWVHYANNVRGYNVKYWAIGNEIEGSHTTEHYSVDDFIRVFKKIAYKMKEADPTIFTTPGTFQSPGWLNNLYDDNLVVSGYGSDVSKAYMDFIVTHQYLHGKTWAHRYASWIDYSGIVIPKVSVVNNWINARTWPNGGQPELFITETGATGQFSPESVSGGTKAFRFHAKTGNKQILHMNSSGQAKVSYENAILDQAMMSMELVANDIGYVKIKALSGSSSQYLRAPGTSGPVNFDGDGTTTDCHWQRYGTDGSCYFENKAFPGYYLSLGTNNNLALDSTILYDAGQKISLEGRVLSGAQKNSGSHLWTSPSDKLLKNYYSKRFANLQSGSDLIEILELRGEDTTAFKFSMEDAGTTSDSEVKLRVAGQSAPGGYLQVTGSSGSPGVDAAGTGADVDSTWIFHYENTDAAGHAIGNMFRLESKKFPGKFLRYEGSGASAGLLTAMGQSDEDESIFAFANPARTWDDSYPVKPVAQIDLDRLQNDFYKSLMWADMLLASLKLDRVGSMVHWNTQGAWGGKYGVWGALSDAFEPTPDLGLTPVGKAQQLVSLLAVGDVLDIADKPSDQMRTYATLDKAKGVLALFVLNKSITAKTLSLSFSGSDAFSPVAEYSTYTYSSATVDIQDIDPTTTVATDLTYPSSGDFTIPPLCLQVLVLTDPSQAEGPIDGRFTLNSLASASGIDPMSRWVKSTANDKVAVVELTEYAGEKYLDLSNIFALSDHDGTASDSYQFSPVHDSGLFGTYDSGAPQVQIELGGSLGGAASAWSWSEGWNSTHHQSHVILRTQANPGKTLRANVSSGGTEKSVDSNGGTGSWAQYLWQFAPLSPLGQTVMIRAEESGYLLRATESAGRKVWLLDTLEGPAAAGGLLHKFHIDYVSDGMITVKNDVGGGNFYLRAGASATDPVDVLGTGSEVDEASYWKPIFKDDRVYLQSAKTGGFLGRQSGSQAVTTEHSSPGIESAFYWVVVP